jgi:hypothetical protein
MMLLLCVTACLGLLMVLMELFVCLCLQDVVVWEVALEGMQLSCSIVGVLEVLRVVLDGI